MKRALFGLLFAIMVNGNAYSEIYKWVDKEGVTHYGQQPPHAHKSEKLDVKVQQSSQTKEIPKEAKEFAEGIVNAKEKTASLDCNKAVDNGQYSLDSMLEVGRKNYKDGYIEKQQYEKMSGGLKKLKSKISLSDCQNSSGNARNFYTCLSSPYNLIVTCGKNYNYPN